LRFACAVSEEEESEIVGRGDSQEGRWRFQFFSMAFSPRAHTKKFFLFFLVLLFFLLVCKFEGVFFGFGLLLPTLCARLFS
jgi:hypothetical protein